MFASNFSTTVLFTLIKLLLFLYIVATALINHSSTPNVLIDHLITFMGTQLNALSRSREVKRVSSFSPNISPAVGVL